MKLKKRCEQGTLTVYLSGELDHHSVDSARAALDEMLEEEEFRYLELDFSGIVFMDSSGIGLVLSRYQQMQKRGIPMRVVGSRGYTRRIFQLAGVTRVVPFDGEEAVTKR